MKKYFSMQKALVISLIIAVIILLPVLYLNFSSSSYKLAEIPSDVQEKEVQRITVNASGLPYEEKLHPDMEEAIRQADYAIINAIAAQDIAFIKATVQEDYMHEYSTGVFHYQRIHIYTNGPISDFVATLRQWFSAVGWKTELVRDLGMKAPDGSMAEVWCVLIDGLTTHMLLLEEGEPKGDNNTVAQGKTISIPSDARRRKPGEVARIVIVMDDMGESLSALDNLIALNYPVTVSVWPYSAKAVETARKAHGAGLEVMLHQPMEPVGYPEIKPGPGTLFVKMTAEERVKILNATMIRLPHVVGVNNHMGSRLTQNIEASREVAREAMRHNLFVLDSLTHPKSRLQKEASGLGVHAYKRDIFLDVEADKSYVLRQLAKAESLATLKGQAIVIGHPLPETLAALKEWQHIRDISISVVPLKSLTPEPVGP